MILEDENSDFIFGSTTNVHTATNFWVINFDRARYKEQIFAGSINLHLSGSNGTVKLTDDSKDNPVNRFLGSSKFYQLISGSNGTAGTLANSGYVAGSGSYGLVFPELGTILLNPQALSQSIHVDAARTSNSNDSNPGTLYNSLVLGSSFTVNSEETIPSDFVFVRARNS